MHFYVKILTIAAISILLACSTKEYPYNNLLLDILKSEGLHNTKRLDSLFWGNFTLTNNKNSLIFSNLADYKAFLSGTLSHSYCAPFISINEISPGKFIVKKNIFNPFNNFLGLDSIQVTYRYSFKNGKLVNQSILDTVFPNRSEYRNKIDSFYKWLIHTFPSDSSCISAHDSVCQEQIYSSLVYYWNTYRIDVEDSSSPYFELNKQIKKERSFIFQGLQQIEYFDSLKSLLESFKTISIYNFNDHRPRSYSSKKNCFNICFSRLDISTKAFADLINQRPKTHEFLVGGGYGCGAAWGLVVIDGKYCFRVPCGFRKSEKEFGFCMTSSDIRKTTEYNFTITDEIRQHIFQTDFVGKCYNTIKYMSFKAN
jgi:hypothetical protein